MADKVQSSWEFARVNTAEAYSLAGHLIIVVAGDKPTPCYRVRIEHVITVSPPDTFAVEWRSGSSPCPDVVTPYRKAATFNIGSTPDKIALLTADGTKTVTVKHLPLREEAAGAAKSGPQTATGYSSRFSFEEAFDNAIQQLPPSFPDELQYFTVIETGAIIGGVAGLHEMFVTIR